MERQHEFLIMVKRKRLYSEKWSVCAVRLPFCVSLVEQRIVETQKVSLGLLWKGRLAGRLGQLLKSSLQHGRLR